LEKTTVEIILNSIIAFFFKEIFRHFAQRIYTKYQLNFYYSQPPIPKAFFPEFLYEKPEKYNRKMVFYVL